MLAVISLTFRTSFIYITIHYSIKKSPEPKRLRAKISAVPPEFPLGHSNAVTGLPGPSYCHLSEEQLRGDHPLTSLRIHTNHTLSERIFGAEPPLLRNYALTLTHSFSPVKFLMAKTRDDRASREVYSLRRVMWNSTEQMASPRKDATRAGP